MAGSILFVVGDPAAMTAGDTFLQSRWVAAGYTVTLIDDVTAAPSPITQDGVIISQSSSRTVVGTKYDSTTKPVLALGMDMKPHTQFATGTTASTGTTSANQYLFNVADPWLAGITGLPKNTAFFTAATVPTSYRTDTTLGIAAVKVAAVRNDLSTRITAAHYEAGDLLADGVTTAPSRRGCISLRDTDMPNLTGDGLTLLDNAVAWTATAALPTATVTFRSRASWAVQAQKNAAAQVSVPTSDISNAGGWTKEDGVTTSNLYAAVADALDATFLQSPNNPVAATVEVHVGTVATGGGTAGWRFRARARKSGTGSTGAVVGLYQGATLIATRTLTFPGGVAFADEEFTLTSGEAGAITDGTNLRLRVTAG